VKLWKWVGLAGVVGITVGAAAVGRHRRREWNDYDPDEVRSRLHERFAAAQRADGTATEES
jgi:hypothetical protein